MRSMIQRKHASLAFPSATTAAARPAQTQGVFRYASSISSTSVAIPDDWKGRFLTFRFFGPGKYVDVAVAFGATPTLALDQPSTVGTGHASAGARVADGTAIDGYVPRDATYLAWISSATGGLVEFWVSEAVDPGART